MIDYLADGHGYTWHETLTIDGVVPDGQSLAECAEYELVVGHSSWHPRTVDGDAF